MSAINANIVVEPINLNVTDTSITQTITVDPISLSVFTAAPASNPPGTPNASLQYNNGNVFGGLANATVSGNTLTFTNLAELKINGGVSGYQLTTDGAGVLSWAQSTSDPTKIINGTSNVEIATVDGNVDFTVGGANVGRMSTTGAAAPGVLAVNGNITAINDIETSGGNIVADTGNIVATAGQFVGDAGGLSNVTATDLNATSTSNVAIGGGVNGYVMQTDGAGSLTWVAQGGAGTGNPGGSNTNIQFNDAGLFGGDTSFTFDKTTDLVTVANLSVSNTTTQNLLVSNTTTIQQAQEKVDLNATPATGTITFDLLDQAIVLQTADATGDFTLNFRGNATTTLDSIMSIGQSMTSTYINKNGSPAFTLLGVQIDGTAQTIEYYNDVSPIAGTANKKDYFTFNIIKTASATFTVLGTTGSLV